VFVAAKRPAGKTSAGPIDLIQWLTSFAKIMTYPLPNQFNPKRRGWSICLVIAFAFVSIAKGEDKRPPIFRPSLVGNWWRVADNPDLAGLHSTNQQPVDFGVWQAADGSWQLWSCIRHTKEAGYTRLFYHWEGQALTNADWQPRGIAMRSEQKYGEKAGGLQAPFVFRNQEKFVMFYGGWDDICSAASQDGKSFDRLTNTEGKVTLFGADSGNIRDPMVIRIGNTWHCYYTMHPQDKGADYCRTSADLLNWGEPNIVAQGGRAGNGPYSAECPFVVELEPGRFYLFRTQRYGKDASTSVYFSTNPIDFGVNNDEEHFVCTLPVAAPEIIKYKDGWFIAALLPSLKGIQLSRLVWDVTSLR
jgi:hypothetical protein